MKADTQRSDGKRKRKEMEKEVVRVLRRGRGRGLGKGGTEQGMIQGCWDGETRHIHGGGRDGRTARMKFCFSFCELRFSSLTSYWSTTWVDNMNANKIGKKKH